MDVIPNVDRQKLYRGKGGEIMRGGVCHLIRAMAIGRIQFAQDKDRLYLFEQLIENFKHPNSEIQEEATLAFHHYCRAYLSSPLTEGVDPVVVEVHKMVRPS